MHRDTKRMLKFLKSSDLLQDGSCMFEDFYDAYCEKTGWNSQRAMACMRQLKADGYISYCQDGYGNTIGFELEHKAYRFRYYSWVRIRSFLINSIIVPVIVSAITAYIAMLISGT